jgi:hypothetical protein
MSNETRVAPIRGRSEMGNRSIGELQFCNCNDLEFELDLPER